MEPGGQLDMQQLLAAAAAMQSQLMNAQQELADAEIEGTAGGGLVRAIVNGQGELVDLSIDAAAIDAGDQKKRRKPSPTWCWRLTGMPAGPLTTCSSKPWRRSRRVSAAGGAGAGLAGLPDLTGFPGFPGAGPAGGGAAAGRARPRRVPTSRQPRIAARRRALRRAAVYEGVVQDLIEELGQLPGVGPKGAQRIAFLPAVR